MPTYALPCPHCQATLEVGVPQAGQEITCPECQQSVTAPRLGALKQLGTVGSAPDPGANPVVDRGKSGLFVAGLLLLVLGGLGGGGLYYYGNSMINEVAVEQILEYQEEQLIDKLADHELLEFKDSMGIEKGLGEWKEQPYVTATKQGRILISISYGVLGLGLIGMVLMFLGIR